MSLRLYTPLESSLKRRIRTPFTDPNNKTLIIHCCYHKVGTAWFIRVLKAIARHYGLNYQDCQQDHLRRDTDIFVEYMSRIDINKLPYYIGSHMVRDPRDMVVSAYFYHLWTKEVWAHIPRASLGGKSYQEYLCEFDQAQGLLVEMKGVSYEVIKEMYDWNYQNPNFIEIKYEDIIYNEEEYFYKIFKHYGFNQEAILKCQDIANRFSFKKKSKRELGQIKKNSHVRSGRPGQWRDFFDEEHKEQFKELFGDVLIKLGYESNDSW